MPAWIQTSSGLAVDLLAPDLSRIDVRRDIAEPLSRIARFAGHMGPHAGTGRIWSVAQHCVVGAKALAEEEGDEACFAFLVHDAHEAFIGDMTRPFAVALQVAISRPLGKAVDEAIKLLKRQLDDAIYSLANRAAPSRYISSLVADMDRRMLDTERRMILGDLRQPMRPEAIWHPSILESRPVRTHGALTPWPAKRAADEWMALWDAWTRRPEIAPAIKPIVPTRREGAAVAA